MNEKRFHRGEYPLETLAQFGLTEEMIYDLPGIVHDRLEMGGKSPLLPITVEHAHGFVHAYAKFCLVDTEDGIDILFSPRLKSADLSRFTEEEQRLLSEGRVVVTHVDEMASDESGGRCQRIKAFVQLDKDTNAVVYVPTQIIGNNIRTLSKEFDLSPDDLQKLSEGGVVTLSTRNIQGQAVPLTVGVDLMSDKGIFATVGNADRWKVAVLQSLPRFSFGNDGCWVNDNGILTYVKEQDFTPEMQQAMQRRSESADATMHTSQSIDDSVLQATQGRQESMSRQLVR